METAGRISIDQWLANVSPGDQGGVIAHDQDRTDAFVSNGGPQLPPMPLETGTTTFAPQQPRLNKRHRDELDAGLDRPEQSDGPRKKIHSYDRNPRRKPREDRYEYQTTCVATGQVHGGRKPKRTKKSKRRARNQTTNVGFHAPNVARDRLTLQPFAMFGIFSKRKSSSPIKLFQDQYHETCNEDRSIKPNDLPSTISGLTFSETYSSFGQRQIPSKSSTSNRIVLGPLEMDYHPYGNILIHRSDADKWSSKPVTNLRNSGSIKSTNAQNENRAMAVKLRESQEPSSPKLIFPGAASQGNCAQQGVLEASKQACLPESQSATPYAWSGSELYQPRLDSSMEDTLLAVFDIKMLAHTSEQSKAVHLDRRYYELKDLQAILEVRRELWEEEASGGGPTTFLFPYSSSRLDHTTYKSQDGRRNRKFHARRVIEEYLSDSDHLFQQLGMLFQEVVSSQDGRPTLEGEQLEIPPPRPGPPHDLKTDFVIFSSNSLKESRYGPRHMAPCDDIGIDTDTSASLRETQSIFRALTQSSSCNKNDLPILLPTNSLDQQLMTQQPSFKGGASRRGPPMRHSTPEQNTIPLGFWRQNKLY
ncbi:hypothetical protein N7533_001078 [Penicillium manginii]|uniref:uncharacterized protein n=1 Tax=Penicillium manginii TaxID=203109 RepID=UPI0025465BE6|nr:uncharacterized protein N7533_001078 [Penicillium manginii]KAJ5768495.1 hypothetical protein N7533_001078 [Penicillium manginii]